MRSSSHAAVMPVQSGPGGDAASSAARKMAATHGLEYLGWHGSAVVGPHGMGIVEDLFTLPAYRKRGIATALIRRAVEHARDRGMAAMLIGALAEETAKSLYVSLGFVPQCLTRHYLLHTRSRASARAFSLEAGVPLVQHSPPRRAQSNCPHQHCLLHALDVDAFPR